MQSKKKVASQRVMLQADFLVLRRLRLPVRFAFLSDTTLPRWAQQAQAPSFSSLLPSTRDHLLAGSAAQEARHLARHLGHQTFL
jgi:hypothetical protein